MGSHILLDTQFKADYISRLLNARKNASPMDGEKAWSGVVAITQSLERECAQYRQSFNEASLKQAFFSAADMGLFCNPEMKESYIGVEQGEKEERLYRFGFCYRGLRRVMLSNPNVTRISPGIVYAGDDFEWKGEWERPRISSKGTGDNYDIVGAYAVLSLKNGDVCCVLLRQHELLDLERLDFERATYFYGDPNKSIYASPWRKRMFEIEAIKALFRQCADMLEITNIDDSGVFASQSTMINGLE